MSSEDSKDVPLLSVHDYTNMAVVCIASSALSACLSTMLLLRKMR